jgi:bifunctional DNA-binding transcriptional regulator/antitoxin component of YhaV-PrlF toxin-antitoxin module
MYFPSELSTGTAPLPKILPNGSLVIPKELLSDIKISIGDKRIAITPDGEVRFLSNNIFTLERAQRAVSGEAERLGLDSDAAVMEFFLDFRKEREGRA